MSDVLFPTLAGLQWNSTKSPKFNVIIQRSANLTELRGSFASQPVYDFVLSFGFLRDNTLNNEMRQLAGFFLARQGAFDSWLYLDPDDNTALLQSFGTGDGSATEFQLRRTLGPFTEPVKNVAAAPLIYKNGVLQTVSTDYTIDSNGLVTFTSPPAGGQPLTWSGTYYYRCRFREGLTLRQFMYRLWDAQQVEFAGALGRQL